MNRIWLRLSTITAGMVLGAGVEDLPASANVIQYSWSGRLVPNDESADPWQIGQPGQPFELTVAVSRNASDLLELDVESSFEINTARLLVNGQEITSVDRGLLGFTDNHAGLYDLLRFNGVFERFGHAIEVGSLLTLPLNTFHFDEFVETPPYFNSTVNAVRSAYGSQGPYTGVTLAGTAVHVVPEPGSVAHLLTLGPLLLLTRRARCIQAGSVEKKSKN